jgi:hypothetical protein
MGHVQLMQHCSLAGGGLTGGHVGLGCLQESKKLLEEKFKTGKNRCGG